MSVLKLTSRTDSDGALRLDVGVPNSKVQVTVVFDDEQASVAKRSFEEWESFVRRTAGSIKTSTFQRQPQGEFPKRAPL